MEKRCQASMVLGGHHSPPNFLVFTSLEALQTQSFWVFKEVSLHRHNLLNCWPLAIDSASSPSPFRGGQGMVLKVPTL